MFDFTVMWPLRYAHDRAGHVIPWDIIRQDLLATQPYEVLGLRGMLAVPYFEKVRYGA